MRTKEQQQAYDEGYAAYTEDKTPYDCPYVGYSRDMTNEWLDGWDTAKEDHREHMDSMSPLREEDYE